MPGTEGVIKWRDIRSIYIITSRIVVNYQQRSPSALVCVCVGEISVLVLVHGEAHNMSFNQQTL